MVRITWNTLFVLPAVCLGQDTDGDGVPDSWEVSHGSDPTIANADSDFDRDHLTLLQEYEFDGGATLNPTGLWRVTPLPFPPGVTSASGSNFAIPDFNGDGRFLVRALVPSGSGPGMVVKSWLGTPDGKYEPIFPGNDGLVVASGLNDPGEVVGLRWDSAQSRPVGFHFSPWAGYRDYDLRSALGLPESNSSLWTYPRQINNDGEMIGLQAGYGSFYQDWLGRIQGFEVLPDLNATTSNPVFSHLNGNGTAIGTYTALDGSFRLFTYQTELTGVGRFHYTDLESEYPEALRVFLEGGSRDFTWEEDGAQTAPHWNRTAWINDHGEFVGKYTADQTIQGLYQGIYYFDGDWLWQIAGSSTNSEEHRISGLNDWPAFVMQIGDMPRMFHEHNAVDLNSLAVVSSSGVDPANWNEAVVRGVNDLGEILVTATDGVSGAEGIFLLSLDQDSDGDGLPDEWETFYGVSEPHLDPDQDGLSNYREFALNLDPNDANSDLGSIDGGSPGAAMFNIDNDGDGIPNTVEVLWGLDPDSSHDAVLDLDGDGLTNFQEFVAGTSATTVDTDRDGITDGEEIAANTDPTNGDKHVQVTAPPQPVVLSPLQ